MLIRNIVFFFFQRRGGKRSFRLVSGAGGWDQNKQQNMWVVASPGFTKICRVDCKYRVKFDPAADLGDPAVGMVLT